MDMSLAELQVIFWNVCELRWSTSGNLNVMHVSLAQLGVIILKCHVCELIWARSGNFEMSCM